MASEPIKQEIDLNEFKGDIFGTRYSLAKDSTTGEVMFDYVELPTGFDVKKIKFFRVKGKDIATVEAELRKLLKKDVPTAENKGKGTATPFVKKTAAELADLEETQIAEHISAGKAAGEYTEEQAVQLGKDAVAAKEAKAKVPKPSGAAAADASSSGGPKLSAAESSGAAARTGDGDGGEEEDEAARVAREAAEAAEAAAERGRKTGVLALLVDEFKGKDDWINKAGEIDAFLASKSAQIGDDTDLKGEIKEAIQQAIAEAVGARAGNGGEPRAGEENLRGGKRSRKHKSHKKSKTRKHKK